MKSTVNCNVTEEEVEELIANRTTNLFVGNVRSSIDPQSGVNYN